MTRFDIIADPELRPLATALNVPRSLNGARWMLEAHDLDAVARIIRSHDIPEIVARLLHHRGVGPDDANAFLFPRLNRDFPDPFLMQGMREVAIMLADAVRRCRRIAVFGDFDVDGATSTAILVRFFRACGLDVPFYIPDRMAEGYGPNLPALAKLKAQGAEIVILADCGTTAFEIVADGAALGLEIVILDHHEAEVRLPTPALVVNPKRKDDASGLTMLAACGVAFMACVAVNAELRNSGWFQNGRVEPPLKDWLDLVALGTVCDMVPLTGVNRLFVKQGFVRMALGGNAGIKALGDVARLTGAPTVHDAGFALGPRINAGSRVHQADLGARLLCTESAEEARNVAFTLEDCNLRRKDIQQEMFDQAVAMVEARSLHRDNVIVVDHDAWHPGLSGLVAGRLKEKYGKPAVVVTYAVGLSGHKEGRGSGRSMPSIHMGNAFIAARNEGLLLKGGGHGMAAGFSIRPDDLDSFTKFLQAHCESLPAALPSDLLAIDGVMTVAGATAPLARAIRDQVGPFGADNAEPVFVFSNVRVVSADIIGTGHVRCMIADWEGGARMKAVAFRMADTPLGRALLHGDRTTPLHLAGSLKIDTWNGVERVELHIGDGALNSGK